jgi:hypothetical protein
MAKESDASKAAKALAARGAAKGGRARASVLTESERSEIARRASRARWGKSDEESGDGAVAVTPPPVVDAAMTDATPFSMYRGTLEIGNVTLECHVLSDGRRVLAAREVVRALRGGTPSNPTSLGQYLSNLPTYREDLVAPNVIEFRVPQNPTTAHGYEATLLIEICDMYLRARDEGLLKSNQNRLATQAEIIVRACAKVGIIALIDEATGYQKVRAKRALQVKLQLFIAENMQEWVSTFPEEFWHELARLEGIRYSPRHRPLRWGKYVMRFVYDSIDPDVGKHLREINPDPHYRKNHHQWLREFGKDKLHRQLGGVIAIMKTCNDMDEFRRRFAKVFEPNPQLELFDLEWDEIAA